MNDTVVQCELSLSGVCKEWSCPHSVPHHKSNIREDDIGIITLDCVTDTYCDYIEGMCKCEILKEN